MIRITRRATSAGLLAAVTAGATSAGQAVAQTPAAQPPAPPAPPTFPDAAATDPVRLGWMQGLPPAADKRIAFEDNSFGRFPQIRWSFSNWRHFLRTVTVDRGDGPVSPLPLALRPEIDGLSFNPRGSTTSMTWRESLAATYTDAIIVLHRGRIVHERYFGVTTPRSQHILFSVTKSFAGTIAQVLIDEGKLDPARTVAEVVPELAGSGFADATVRQVLDMTTGLAFDEVYTSPQSGIARYAMAGRVNPRPPGYSGPEGFYDYARTVAKEGVHGAGFTYRTINTEVLAWMIARVEGKPFDQVLGERIWSRIGAEADAAITVDGVGTPMAGGGLCVRLRDLARFGEVMRRGGRVGRTQVIPAASVAAIARGGDPSRFPAHDYPGLPGGSYHAQWWFTHNANGVWMARGIHGQGIYIDPAAQMVIARFGSHPIAGNGANDPVTLPAYAALSAHLMG